MILNLNIGKAVHLVSVLEYYEKQFGLTDPMRYVLWDLKELINNYDKKSNS